jgi:RNA recognition motif-containing protein
MFRSIYVCNLSSNIDERFLKNIFSRYGEVYGVKIVRDRETRASRGFGFVKMSERDCENAIQHLNGYLINQKKLIVKYDIKEIFD